MVTTEKEVIWTSVQRVELIALIKALQLEKEKKKSIYSHSWYAFAKIHVHGAICRETGLLTETKKWLLKNNKQSLDLL